VFLSKSTGRFNVLIILRKYWGFASPSRRHAIPPHAPI